MLKKYDVINVFEKIADRAKTGKGKNMENNEEKMNNAEDNEKKEEVVKVDEGKERSEQNKEKLFTQEEVNNIVKNRLYERKKEKKNINEELDKREKDIEERESSVKLRENRVECCEIVNEKGYKKELLEILDTSDPEKFREQAEKLNELYKGKEEEKRVYPGAERNIIKRKSDVRPFADTKHKPKQY